MYFCLVVNLLGIMEKRIFLVVVFCFCFYIKLFVRVDVIEGDILLLNCSVIGDLKLVVRWKKYGE